MRGSRRIGQLRNSNPDQGKSDDLGTLVRKIAVATGQPITSPPHYASAEKLFKRVEDAIVANPALATNPELAELVGILPHLDTSPLDMSGPTSIAIEAMIAEAKSSANGDTSKGGAEKSAKKLRQIVLQRVGIRPPVIFLVSGVLLTAYFTFLLCVFIGSPAQILGIDTKFLAWVAVAGSTGGVVSMLYRVPEFARQRKADTLVLFITGVSKPLIGSIFAVFVYILFESGLAFIKIPREGANANLAYIAIGFIAGFSERFAPDLLSRAEGNASSIGTH